MQVALSALDPKFKYEVANHPGGENIKYCFACGVCTAGCPVSEIDDRYNPRQIIRKVLLGMREEVLGSDTIWLCISCNTCTAHCPQNVKFSDVMGALRAMAVDHGYVHKSFDAKVKVLDKLAQEIRRKLVMAVVEKRKEDFVLDPDQLARQILGE